MSTLTEIEAAIEKLSPQEQEQFNEWYERRLASTGLDVSVDEAWADEVKRRMEQLDSGKVQAIPAEQVFARSCKILGHTPDPKQWLGSLRGTVTYHKGWDQPEDAKQRDAVRQLAERATLGGSRKRRGRSRRPDMMRSANNSVSV